MNNTRFLPLAALLLVVAGCDFKETRVGQIALAGGVASIPLNGKNGAASLTAGRAEVTFKKGSADNTIAIRVRQQGIADVEFEAAVSKGYESGNFVLKGADIGQPVDLASARSYAVTGPAERYSEWTDEGFQTCRVDVMYDPCVENWTVGFRAPSGAELGSFSSSTPERCNERRGFPYACRPNRQHEPRIPDFPRDGGRGRHVLFERLSETGAANVKFD